VFYFWDDLDLIAKEVVVSPPQAPTGRDGPPFKQVQSPYKLKCKSREENVQKYYKYLSSTFRSRKGQSGVETS
jgi:hypothetical protein